MPDEENPLMSKLPYQLINVFRQRPLIITGSWFVRISSTSQIGNDNSVTLRQPGHDIPPHIPGFSKAMQQYDRLTSPARHIMQTYVIDFSRVMRERSIELCPI